MEASAGKVAESLAPKRERSSQTKKKSPTGKEPATEKWVLASQDLLRVYENMLVVRRFEERAGQLYGMGLIAGFCHLYIGQEAVVAGVVAARGDEDSIITGYRAHGHALLSGIEPEKVMAELMGRAGGCSGGKGGSMHMFSRRGRFFGGHGIVGAQVPIGTGVAFAEHYRGSNNVCVTFLGDGAVNQGQVYEAFNMAGLWSLPVVYVIENNRYAMGTSVERASAETQLCRRGDSFSVPGAAVDGMDVEAVYAAMCEALEFVRAGNGPTILEMKTYRYRGHSMSDPGKYRSRDEINQVRKHTDPLDILKERLVERGISNREALAEMDKQVRARIARAAEHAQAAPEPEASALFTDVLLTDSVTG